MACYDIFILKLSSFFYEHVVHFVKNSNEGKAEKNMIHLGKKASNI